MTSTSEIKNQLWTVASRLQRAQSKFEALAQAARKDIASAIAQEYQLRPSDNSIDSPEHEKALSSLRLKAEKLIVDDESCDLMGLLERYCDILSEGKLSDSAAQLGQDCLEAISGILATASRIDSPELHTLSHSLAQRYPALLEEAELRENVSLKLLPHLNPGRPSQTSVDAKIVVIAQSHGQVAWSPPGLLPEDRQKLFITMLKSTPADTETIDLGKLRQLCCYSIPSTAPAWLRLRAWSILLGVLPLDRRKWHHSAKRARADYLALSQQVLATLSSAPPPLDGSSTLSTQDKALVQFSKDVEALPGSIRDALLHCTVPSEPASTDDSQDARHTDAVLSRIHVIKNRNRSAAGSTQITPLIPTITLDDPPTSPFSPTAFYTSQEPSPPVPTILLSSSSTSINILLRLLYIHSMLHSSHATSLGPPSSLAAIFAVILTLALQAQATPSETLLSPVEETDKAEPLDPLIQIEADVFWMVEAIVGNTRELLDGGEEGDEIWSRRFSNVVRWADNELWMDLSRKGLDPALPYYSYRWIPTLFTHTLPLNNLLPIWDVIFSISNPQDLSFQQGVSPQAEFIYTVGATMLIRARAAIFQSSLVGQDKGPQIAGNASPSGGLTSFWKRQSKTSSEIALPHSPSPYSPIASPKTPLSPTVSAVPRGAFAESHAQGSLTPGRLSNIFLVAVKLLQEYDVNVFGGIERLLCGAMSLWWRWCREGRPMLEPPKLATAPAVTQEEQGRSAPYTETGGGVAASLGRLRDLAWKGMTNEVDDNSDSPSPVEREPEPPRRPTPQLTITSPVSEKGTGAGFFSSFGGGLGSRLTESVWKGVTNQLDSPEVSPEVSPEPSPRSSILVADDEIQPKQAQKPTESSSWAGEGALSWAKGYADRLKGSDVAANLTRTGSTLRAKASTVWTRESEQQEQSVSPASVGSPEPQLPTQHKPPFQSHNGTMSPATSSVGSWGEMFSKRGSHPLVTGDHRSRDGSESSAIGSPAWPRDSPVDHKRDSYSPPAKPSNFRAARESVIGSLFSKSSPVTSHLPNTPPSAESGAANPLQAALAALSGTPKVETPKRGPKPLLLNSSSLITPSAPRSGLSSRRPSPSPTPTPRPGDRFSLSTSTEGDDTHYNTSGVVSLRRGPLTNPRTAGYGVSNTSREGTRSSRASTSSGMSSPALSARGFSVDLDSESDRRGLTKKQSKGFLVDRGFQIAINEDGLEESPAVHVDPPLPEPVTLKDKVETQNNPSSDSATEETRIPSKHGPKRHQNRPAPITTDSPSISVNDLPELMITTPRSGESQQQHVSPDTGDVKDLTVIGTPVSSLGGASLSRSKSSTRRTKKSRDGSADARTPRAMKRPGRNLDENRDSMLSVGSEEDGAKADVEDMDDIYEMY